MIDSSIYTVIIILGSPNKPDGKLSSMATERLDKGLSLFREYSRSRILLTGGWGPHFNISTEAHALHAQRYLEKEGLNREDFLPHALSSSTIEDARLSEPILRRVNPREVLIVTSDFHLERTRAIFGKFLDRFNLFFHEAPHRAEQGELARLREHERQALERFNRSVVRSKGL